MKIVILVVPDSTVVSATGRVSTVVQIDCSPSIRQVELHLPEPLYPIDAQERSFEGCLSG